MSTRLSGLVLRTQSDERLAALAGSGQESAFAVLVQRYQHDLTVHARRIVGDARADDAVQDGLSRTWQTLQQGTELQNARAWMYRVVGNAALDIVRERARSDSALSDQLPGGSDPATVVAAGMETRAVLAQIADLPEQQRDALLLTAVEGRSGEEAAAMLGVSEGALSQLVFRARSAMRATMTALTPYPVLTWATTTSDVAVGGGAIVGGLGVKALAALALGGATVGGATVAVKQEDRQREKSTSTIEQTTTAGTPTLSVPLQGVGSQQTTDRTSTTQKRSRDERASDDDATARPEDDRGRGERLDDEREGRDGPGGGESGPRPGPRPDDSSGRGSGPRESERESDSRSGPDDGSESRGPGSGGGGSAPPEGTPPPPSDSDGSGSGNSGSGEDPRPDSSGGSGRGGSGSGREPRIEDDPPRP